MSDIVTNRLNKAMVENTLKHYNKIKKDPNTTTEVKQLIDEYNEVVMVLGKRVLESNKRITELLELNKKQSFLINKLTNPSKHNGRGYYGQYDIGDNREDLRDVINQSRRDIGRSLCQDDKKTLFKMLTHDLYTTFEYSKKDEYRKRIKETIEEFVKDYGNILGM